MPYYPASPAGSNQQVQFNNNGVLAGASAIQTNGTNWGLSGTSPSAVSTGYSVTGGTPTKTLTLGTASATTITNWCQQLATDLIAKGIISS